MKKYILSLILFGIISCNEPENTATDYGAQIAGTYKATQADISGKLVKLPQNDISMGVKLTRINNNRAKFLLIASVSGNIQQEGSQVLLSQSGERITMIKGFKQIGYIKDKNIHLDFVSEDGSKVILEAGL
ncbi:hypothetical protein [Dyadobacter sp. NIV53]|uniref:hypothetical protein n=1 Tax=Dyadobacter sp. NIV53 TaxID=2861765 RepID=UPI001C8801DA|nr:hypothetical protein [Dyadobacter sp. NIV53]